MENLPGAELKNCLWSDEHTLPSFSFSPLPFLSLSFSSFSSSFHSITPLLRYRRGCDATSRKRLTWLITSDREKRERERQGSLVRHLFFQAIISNYEQADGDAEHLWLQRAEVPPPPQARHSVFSYRGFHSSVTTFTWTVIFRFYSEYDDILKLIQVM